MCKSHHSQNALKPINGYFLCKAEPIRLAKPYTLQNNTHFPQKTYQQGQYMSPQTVIFVAILKNRNLEL